MCTHLLEVSDEAGSLDAVLHIEADVHFNLCVRVGQFDDWHLDGRTSNHVKVE